MLVIALTRFAGLAGLCFQIAPNHYWLACRAMGQGYYADCRVPRSAP